MKRKKKYVIVKEMTDAKGKVTSVLLNDGLSQVYETSNKKKVEKMVEVLNINSDSGHKYSVRKIGTRI